MNVKSATGTTGFILNTVHGCFFRVYEKDSTAFRDYELRHSDLEVTIQCDDAVFYELDIGVNLLDHSPETLGIDIK